MFDKFVAFCYLLISLLASPGLLRGQNPADSFRLVTGLEKTAAVSAEPVQKLFVDLYFDRALAGSARTRAWGNLRLASLPRSVNSTILSAPGDIVSSAATATLNELTQSGEFLVGMEFRLTNAAANRANVSLIASYGASTPLLPDPGRNGFQREYYGGLRIGGASSSQTSGQTSGSTSLTASGDAGRHVVDIAIGQNDAVTGGAWRGTVLRVDSFFALPVSGDVFYLFGMALAKTTGTGRAGVGFSQDVYRVGAGIDVVQLLKVLRSK